MLHVGCGSVGLMRACAAMPAATHAAAPRASSVVFAGVCSVIVSLTFNGPSVWAGLQTTRPSGPGPDATPVPGLCRLRGVRARENGAPGEAGWQWRTGGVASPRPCRQSAGLERARRHRDRLPLEDPMRLTHVCLVVALLAALSTPFTAQKSEDL